VTRLAWVIACLAFLSARGARADQPGEKSKLLAVGIAVGATAVPLILGEAAAAQATASSNSFEEPPKGATSLLAQGLVIGGLVLGPSAGYLYVGDWKYAAIAAGGKASLFGLGLLAQAVRGQGAPDNDFVAMLPALAIFLWDVVDFVLLPSAVQSHNESLAAPITSIGGRLTFTW